MQVLQKNDPQSIQFGKNRIFYMVKIYAQTEKNWYGKIYGQYVLPYQKSSLFKIIWVKHAPK